MIDTFIVVVLENLELCNNFHKCFRSSKVIQLYIKNGKKRQKCYLWL